MSLYRSYKWLGISKSYTQEHVVDVLRDIISDIMELGDEIFKNQPTAPIKRPPITWKGKNIEECTNEELKECIRYLNIGKSLGCT